MLRYTASPVLAKGPERLSINAIFTGLACVTAAEAAAPADGAAVWAHPADQGASTATQATPRKQTD